jgi:acetate kinase
VPERVDAASAPGRFAVDRFLHRERVQQSSVEKLKRDDSDGAVVVFNAGSSSLKAEAYGLRPWRCLARASCDSLGPGVDRESGSAAGGASPHAAAAERVIDALAVNPRRVVATGHRIVHGGAFAAPVEITAGVLAELDSLSALAPLHNPPALDVLEVARRAYPNAPAVAVFDTAFFSALPEHVRTYAVPAAWRRDGLVRRYGFHGIAHAELHRRYREFAGRHPRPERVVSLHLGQGCSAAAILDGRPLDTSMGYTPLEGLIMGTRPGDLDVGVVLERMRSGMTERDIDAALSRQSGLLALSGASSDVREILALEARGDMRAKLALDAFCHRIVKYVGAYAAVLGGIDALLFGGGIGEHSAPIRERICAQLAWLGLDIDRAANAACTGREGAISPPASRVAAFVLAVREERSIARAVCEHLYGDIALDAVEGGA